MTSSDILDLIQADEWMMTILRAARDVDLPDWWIGAGFIRSKIWDYLHGFRERTPIRDVDVIFFDQNTILTDEEEQIIQARLAQKAPNVEWSVTNQARMHGEKGDLPYQSAEDGLKRWHETATCIGVKLLNDHQLVLLAPWGIEDLVNLVVRANSACKTNPQAFIKRTQEKKWQLKWPKLKIIMPQ